MRATDDVKDKAYTEMEMLEAWREFLDALLPYIKLCGEMAVKNIAKNIMNIIKAYVYEENTFTMKDEEVFGEFDRLMADYAEITGVYGDSLADINDFRVSEILNGITEILTAELKQYEEHMGAFRAECGAAFKNPVREEKERLLKAVYERVFKSLRVVLAGIFSEHGYFDYGELKRFCAESAGKNESDSHIDFFIFIYQRIIERGGLDVYKSYSGPIMECSNNVNSLELRKEARYFYDALKQEKENLSSIVKIQVKALTEEPLSGDEKTTVDKVVNSLNGALNRTEAKTEELDNVFGGAESSVIKPVLMNYDGFLSYIEEDGLCAYAEKLRAEGLEAGTLTAVKLWKEKLDKFIKLFKRYVDEEAAPAIDIKPYKRFLYEARVKITDKIFLTDGIINGFKGLAAFYSENAEKLNENVPEEYKRIIDGIHESVLIKIETLLEGKKEFFDDTEKMLNKLAPPDLTETDSQTLLNVKLSLWYDEMLGLDSFSQAYDSEAEMRLSFALQKIKEASQTEEYGSKIEKKIAKDSADAIKLETSYLKDCLLFEIITFEEIITYSVSKLKECDAEMAAEYVRLCDELAEKLIKLCKLHNIMIIKPMPYDIFNSSEHEVLVAEKTEGYKKGQIIKMMNSGFKYNEQVLVRANVIAAR